MGTSISSLGPAAQRQIIEQIAMDNQRRAEAATKPVKRSKYGNIRTEYKSCQGFSRIYDSKGEAGHAAMLDQGIVAGLVRLWLPQVTIPLQGGVKYRADFLVVWADGRIVFQDFKGTDTQESINKRKQVREGFSIDVEIVKTRPKDKLISPNGRS